MKGGLCPQLAAVGDMATCYGTVKRVDGQFLQERQEQDQYDFVGYSANPAKQTVITMVADETAETQEIANEGDEVRREVRIHYGEMMDFADSADSAISQALCSHRKMHWTTAHMIWVSCSLLQMRGSCTTAAVASIRARAWVSGCIR